MTAYRGRLSVMSPVLITEGQGLKQRKKWGLAIWDSSLLRVGADLKANDNIDIVCIPYFNDRVAIFVRV